MGFAKGHVVPDEWRRRIAEKLIGRPGHAQTAETRLKISATKTGQKVPKLSVAVRGRRQHGPRQGPLRVHSPESRAKMSAVRKGVAPTPKQLAHLDALAEKMRGKPLSPQHRQRIGDGLRVAFERGRRRVPAVNTYTRLAQTLHGHLSRQGLVLEPEVRFGRFTVDLYDRANHVAYEADGRHWHELAELRRPGWHGRRDAYLMDRFGLAVVHFSEPAIRAMEAA